MDLEVIRELVVKNDSKIVLLVIDGLGGLPNPETGRSELEEANTIHLDRLAADGLCGMTVPVGLGITPGSGPGHLALFGYDPLKYRVGRGVLEALGIDFDLRKEDLAARGNFCTIDSQGLITDRRAGRISTETCAALCEGLSGIKLPGVQVFVQPVREHRFLLVLRGEGLAEGIADTDPQRLGMPPLPAQAQLPEAEATARLLNDFVAQARKRLADKHPANMLLLRGVSKWPDLPHMGDVFGLNAVAVAVYPMYRGLAKLVGMTVLPTGMAIQDELATVQEHWQDFDFFFIHYKTTDSRGEDGDYDAKVAALEEVDSVIPGIRDLSPDVLMVAGDHSTPSLLAGQSWHSVPFVMWSRWCRTDRAETFDENACRAGGLGTFPATAVLPLALANAQRLTKYGA
ncbi:MAG: 2,3-bisphosphoglycerate-independent phosphoglycerate mutase [Dehalococcoidia bacterium]|nr:2,3-bisphosphoglycerate-independent phosphoglycerate mutase [Dehalococcoidia bacterium]